MLAAQLLALALFIPSQHSASYVQTAENTSVIIKAWVEIDPLEPIITTTKHHAFFHTRTIVAQSYPDTIIEKDKFICSGVVIASHNEDEIVLTARHCAEDSFEYTKHHGMAEVSLAPTSVQFFDGDIGTVKNAVNDVYSAPDDDVLIMKVHSRHHHPAAKLNDGELSRTQGLFGFGAPDGNFWSMVTASANQGSTVVDIGENGWNQVYEVEAPAMDHGISGGPMFDRTGQVVGIMVGAIGSNNLRAIVPAFRIKRWLHTLAR